MKYLIPGKTFLLGEYSALVGGSVLGLATGPGFLVDYRNTEALVSDEISFSPQSPAGLLSKPTSSNGLAGQIATEFAKFKLTLTDLFRNCGGFGKSTAEYLAVLIPWLQKNEASFESIREQYQLISRQSGAEASGLDLAIQFWGKVTLFDSHENKYSSLDWKMKGYDFILVSTGTKLKTHEHIQTIDLKKISHFPSVSNPLVELYQTHPGSEFIRGIKEWSAFLKASHFMSDSAFELKELIESDPNVLCAKPCGAMGADVIAVLCETEKSELVQNKLRNLNIKIQSTSAELLPGVNLHVTESVAKVRKQHHVG